MERLDDGAGGTGGKPLGDAVRAKHGPGGSRCAVTSGRPRFRFLLKSRAHDLGYCHRHEVVVGKMRWSAGVAAVVHASG